MNRGEGEEECERREGYVTNMQKLGRGMNGRVQVEGMTVKQGGIGEGQALNLSDTLQQIYTYIQCPYMLREER